LSDSARSREEQANTVHVGKASVQRGGGSELLLEIRLEATVELSRLQVRQQYRNTGAASNFHQFFRKLLPLGDEDARHPVGEVAFQVGLALVRRERTKVPDFRFAEHLKPLARKAIHEAREDQPGAGRLCR